ncbi:MAG: proline--tRNA ligase [Candidatus Sericytochromatia bacterium]|nr:proline--tRNA ligase [Candidatus Sericytochromatia bacterium]
MRMSTLLAPTLREVPADAEIISHQLLARAGFIRRLSPGVYNLLPLMNRVVKKVEQIVREEMDAAGAQELLMPVMIPAELWMETGRWQKYGKELVRFKNRHDRDEVLGPTHEEVITDIVRGTVRSYRQIPINLYQIQTKVRDEIRPRFGLLRGREFIMKDAYSFHESTECLESEYTNMADAYTRIFARCGLDTRPVESDVGAIGGSAAHEFMVVVETDAGENALLYCDHCDYAANVERAESILTALEQGAPVERRVVETPATRTIEQLCTHLQCEPQRIAKTLVYVADETLVAVVIRGDLSVNEVKLSNILAANQLRLATEEEIRNLAGVAPGFVGPIGLRVGRVMVDRSLMNATNLVMALNESDVHAVGVNAPRDWEPADWVDVRTAQLGEGCPRCASGSLKAARGIEVGNIFKLGTKYSDSMGATYTTPEGGEKPFIMGCYGIGITRTAQAAVEAHHDENGIKWPVPIAPFHVAIVPVNHKEPTQWEAATRLYEDAVAAGLEVVLDDREERAGVKFKDAELIGFPFRLTCGKALASGRVELFIRATGEKQEIALEDAVSVLRALVSAQMSASKSTGNLSVDAPLSV